MTVRLHPERTEDPATLRWVLPGRDHGLERCVARADGALAGLLRAGVLTGVRAAPGRIETTLAPERSWAHDAARVRAAVIDTVAAGPAGDDPDVAVETRQIAQQILERDIAPLAGAHGGRITIVAVEHGPAGDIVRVSLAGACHGCPAASSTLQGRFQRELQRRVPGARVVADAASAAEGRSPGVRRVARRLGLPMPTLRHSRG